VAVPARRKAGSTRLSPAEPPQTERKDQNVSVVTMRELLEAGVHFGHQTRRWNPKMKRYIFGERGGIYIIDLQQTMQALEEAALFARNLAERNGTVLFVGTKKQAQDAIKEQAQRTGMPYVNHRWLGGLLTNWRTISDRIARLHELRQLRDEGQLGLLPPKERIAMEAELEKLEANLGGVADMRKQPDAMLVIDLRKEQLAVREARRLGLPIIALVGRGRLRGPGQRRRDPLVRAGRAGDRRRDRGRQGQGDAAGLRARAGGGDAAGAGGPGGSAGRGSAGRTGRAGGAGRA
jgi:ribosomal protein S2